MLKSRIIKIGIVAAALFISINSIAQADLKNDNYIFTENYWDSSFSKNSKKKDSIKLTLLPITNKLQWVQDHAYNWNDGAMVPAKGIQQSFRAGLHAQWNFVELQIAPEMILAQNLSFDDYPTDNDEILWRDYYRFYNSIELPDRMGTRQYSVLSPGQSFLKFHYKNLGLAISTANKWWGPTQRNALLLSSTAAGFPHIVFSNQVPIQTQVGKFNFEIITGKLTNGGWLPPNSNKALRGNLLYVPKQNKPRIVNGFNVSYQPKWFSNLTIGAEQMYMQYEKDMVLWQDYLPVKSPFSRIPDDKLAAPVLMTGFYFNYEMPKAGATIYTELGWNLNQTTLRNWMIQPDKGFASTFGLKKIFQTQAKHYWELLAEITQLQLLTRAEQFTNGAPVSWYLGSNVRQGYTHDGQLIGAGVGPGGSSQFVELNWRKQNNRIGISVERRVHNNDYLVYAFTGSQDYRRFYIDFVTTFKMDWQYKKWTIGPRLSYIQTNNYNWYFVQTENFYFLPGRDVQQFTGQLNVQYNLNTVQRIKIPKL